MMKVTKKLNMVITALSIAMILAVIATLTGCSRSVNATSGNSATAESVTAPTEPEEPEEPEPETPLAPTPELKPTGSKDAADYWISSDEFDMKGYLEAWGFQHVYYSEKRMVADNGTYSPWIFFLTSVDTAGSTTLMIQGMLRSRPQLSMSASLTNTGQRIKITGTELDFDKVLVESVIKIMPYSDQQFEDGFRLQELF